MLEYAYYGYSPDLRKRLWPIFARSTIDRWLAAEDPLIKKPGPKKMRVIDEEALRTQISRTLHTVFQSFVLLRKSAYTGLNNSVKEKLFISDCGFCESPTLFWGSYQSKNSENHNGSCAFYSVLLCGVSSERLWTTPGSIKRNALVS